MAIAVATTLQLSAQSSERKRMTPEQRTEQLIKRMDEKLNLTDEQEKKIRELYANFNKQKYSREQHKEMREKLTAEINLLLTTEQQAAYKEMRAQAAADMKNRKRQRTGSADKQTTK